MKSKETSIAVVGSGYWGKNLVRNFNSLDALKMICDKNETILAEFQRQYPKIEVCLAFNEILNRSDIDGVAISTPAETHYRLAREALLAGKHVFVEKPLVLNEKEGLELIEIARQKQLKLMVGHLLQYHPIFIKLKELARSGQLGRINYIYSNRLNLGKIRREENILWSFAPHDISMILALAGEEPESVISTGGNYLHKKIADVTTTHLEFPSGMQAHIFVSWLHPFKEQKLVVVGDRKMAVFDDTKPWEDKLLLYSHRIDWQNNLPVPTKGLPERLEIPQDEPLKCECLHFIDCITNGSDIRTDGSEGLRVLRVLKASQISLDQNGRKITPSGQDLSLKETAEEKASFIHPTAVVDDGVTINEGSKIWHFSHILDGSKIGKDCNIGQNVVIGPKVSIGNGCKIQNNVSVYQGVTLEDGVFCGPSMVFTNIYNPRAEIRKMDQVRPTIVKKGATLGANSTIVCGNTIGEYAFIGAGAVVTSDVPPHGMFVGNPAVHKGWACVCGSRLYDDYSCSECNRKYVLKDNNEGLEKLSDN